MTTVQTITAILDTLTSIDCNSLNSEQIRLFRIAEGNLTLLEASLNGEPLDDELAEHVATLQAA